MRHDSLLLLWLIIHPPLAGCVWGVMGVLMDRKQMLWMKVVREWIGSMDEGPVMVDYVIMRREGESEGGGERGRAITQRKALRCVCSPVVGRKTNKTEEGEREEEEGGGEKTGETLLFLSQPKPQERNSNATQLNAGTQVEDEEEEGQAKEEESGEANSSSSSSSQSSLGNTDH
jgi:hypothetical protein